MAAQSHFCLVVPHRNRPGILAESLARTHMLWRDWISETIVVDDASEPEHWPAGCPESNIRVLFQPANRGPAACRNIGVRAAGSDYILFLDDDSWPESGDLAAVAAAFQAHERLAAIGFQVRLGENCESGGAFNAIVGCGAAVRRSAFLEVGGFREEFAFYGEEYSLCYRLIEAGWHVRMWWEPSVIHAKTPSSRNQAHILRQLVLNNRRLYEAQAKHRLEVAERLQEVLAWYRVLGSRYACAEGVAAAISQEVDLDVATPWSDSTWQALSGFGHLNEFARELAARKPDPIALWPVGKDTASFARALVRNGLQPMEVLDPDGRYGIETFAGLPVRKEPTHRPATAVVCSFSPGLCWNGLHGPALAGIETIDSAFGFVGPGDSLSIVAAIERRSNGNVSRFAMP